jgi:hypothetical protein
MAAYAKLEYPSTSDNGFGAGAISTKGDFTLAVAWRYCI